jgi:competence protein ComEA
MKRLFAILLMTSGAVFAEPVSINQADAETLSRALNGIGPKKAEAIIQYRKEHGDFKSLKELEDVKGIGPKTVQLNEKDILLTPSAPVPAGEEKKVNVESKDDSAKKPK